MSVVVSVIIPVYNGERFLRTALDSALAQTYQPLEVIAVNDGSTDGSAAILVSYGDRVRVLSQKNSGQATARNTGIAAARGEWVAFLDQDDLWDPRKIEVQMGAVAPGDDMVHCNARVIDDSGTVVRETMAKPTRDGYPRLADVLAGGYPVQMCTAVVRRAAVEAVGGFDVANRFGTDDAQLKYALAATGHRFHYVDRVLASYRVHGGGHSQDFLRMYEGVNFARARVREKYPDAFDAEVLRACAREDKQRLFMVGWQYFQRGEYDRAAGFFRRSAICCSPMQLKGWLYWLAAKMPGRGCLVPLLRRHKATLWHVWRYCARGGRA